jgi:hypothetical protein
MRSQAKIKNDSIFFYIKKEYHDYFKVGENVQLIVNGKIIVGKVIRSSNKLYVRIPKSFISIIKEGENVEIKKIS